jgi:hypothetical protein
MVVMWFSLPMIPALRELARQLRAAGIDCLQQILPEHTVMMIYTDQVQVGSNIDARPRLASTLVGSAGNNAAHSLQVLSHYLASPKRSCA